VPAPRVHACPQLREMKCADSRMEVALEKAPKSGAPDAEENQGVVRRSAAPFQLSAPPGAPHDGQTGRRRSYVTSRHSRIYEFTLCHLRRWISFLAPDVAVFLSGSSEVGLHLPSAPPPPL
jgi:hypothetical protein